MVKTFHAARQALAASAILGLGALLALSSHMAQATGSSISVSTATQLKSALSKAMPGDTIVLADGVYKGNFTIQRPGSSSAPITLKGSRAAIIDGGSTTSGYTLGLNAAHYWVLEGFTVTRGMKGIMVDRTHHAKLHNLDVYGTGDEAVHLRTNSTDNIVSYSQIHDVGKSRPQYGEGIYVGSAKSNWSSVTGSSSKPDKSDRNWLIGNKIYRTTAENIDIKEGSSAGVVKGNQLYGEGMTEADSWVDVKGNGYKIEENTGVGSSKDGFQTHVEASGWGNNNVFANNKADVKGGIGYGFWIKSGSTGNVVYCANTVLNAAKGFANTTCKK